MEAFEQFVAVALESEGLVVSSGLKIPVRRKVAKLGREEWQEHGYEVDLVGARADRLVLATVKSFFGSKGVQARAVTGEGRSAGLYRMLNDEPLREAMLRGACERFGYCVDQVTMRLYVGKFAGKEGRDEALVRSWCASQRAGAGPIEVVTVDQVVAQVRSVAAGRTYVNNPVIVAMKVLAAARLLDLQAPIDVDALEQAAHESEET